MEPQPSSAPFMPPISILLFGDSNIKFEQDLTQLLHRRKNAQLQAFFEQVNLAFRHEFARLPSDEQEWFPRFTNLVDLMANIDGTVGSPAVKSGLLCVYQIGRVLDSATYPDVANTHIVGVCTGAFAAVAVAASRTMQELISAGVESALVAFRTGLHSLRMQRVIELSSGQEAWSFVTSLSESKGQDVLEQFCRHIQLPPTSRPYISAVTPTTLTISGPPQVLTQLIESSALKSSSLAIHSPYHASHLYLANDVDTVLGTLHDDSLEHFFRHFPLLSLASGIEVHTKDFKALLRGAIADTLCAQVRWDKLGPGLGSKLTPARPCAVYPIASNAGSLLCSAIKRSTGVLATLINNLNANLESPDVGPAPGKFSDAKIAIVGFSGRYPDAASNEALWEVLKSAKDCHRLIPEDRFDWEAHYDPTGKRKNTSKVKHGCFIDEPGVFDAKFFNLSPREAENADPAQRLALMAAYEAMEMAGLVPDRTPSTQRDRIGVFFGVTSDDYREINSGQEIDTYFIPGGNRAFVPGRISYSFRLSGPSISVDTACSSSFAAISTACGYLRQGDCDSAIAGGTNVLTNPDNFAGLDRGHFLSPTGNCNPFDDGANGYCRADAVGAVILKRLDDAIADSDPIFGVIAGASTNHCGQSVSITRPHEGDQLSLFRRILRQSNTAPLDVSYVEMHGTGTQAGDAAEMRSVLGAMAWDDQRSRLSPPRPLHLGAIKANVGHAESASGVTALIKVLLMMQHSEIPPQRIDGPRNRGYPADLEARNVWIKVGSSTPWRREECPNQTRTAFLNNFSAAGGNTALLLEDAPRKDAKSMPVDPRSCLPVAVSAKTARSLSANLIAIANHLEQHPETSLAALSYTTTARRAHNKFRVLVSGSTVAAVAAALRRRAQDVVKPIKGVPPKQVFVFTGQGALYAGLAQQLFDNVSMFRANLVQYDQIAQRQGFPSFLEVITNNDKPDGLANPVQAQLALTCVQMALTRLWTVWSGSPAAVVGHSLGEYAAMFAAGVLSPSDVIYLVGSRAQLLTKLCKASSHSMLAVKASLSAFEQELAEATCTVACINSPVNTVISGSNAAVEKLANALKTKGIETVTLDVPYAFHSAQMDAISPAFEALAASVKFNKPTVPYLSALIKESITEEGILNASYVARAARECVNFQGAIEAARRASIVNDSSIWIEIGAHPACSTMIKQIIDSPVTTVHTLQKNMDTWRVLASSLEALYEGGSDIRWEEYHRGFEAAQQVIRLPAYQWDLQNYWIQYRYNFCLTKGDDPALFSAIPPPPVQLPVAAPLLSSSVHSVIQESHSAEYSELLTESDIQHPTLLPIVAGHKVNGAMLCPSSLYADMALTISKHMLDANGLASDTTGLDCSTMKVIKPVVALPDATSQLLRVKARADWQKQTISLRFFTVDAKREDISDHATCEVKITKNNRWFEDWKRTAFLVKDRISQLRQAVDIGSAHKLNRGLVYKLFSVLVDYAPNYQGMDQVILNSDSFEATAQVNFKAGEEGFDWNPCWIDSLGHIAGFIMNGTENPASKDLVFINHGWEAMRCAKPIEAGKSYTTYNRMHLESGTTYVGDTYILEDDQVVAIFEGVRFQGVNRAVLDHLLPSKGATRRVAAAPKASSTRATPGVATNKAAVASIPIPSPTSKWNPSPRKGSEVLRIIAEEVQISAEDLELDAEFTDFGVDSLLSLTIASRLRDELGIEVSPSAFADYPTSRELIKSIAGDDQSNEAAPLKPSPPSTIGSGMSTPPSLLDDLTESYSTDATSTSSESDPNEIDVTLIVRKIISEETGIPLDELSPSSQLAELGVDSLLSLSLTSIISEQIDAPLPVNLIADSETLDDIYSSLRRAGLIRSSPTPSAASNPAVDSKPSFIDTRPPPLQRDDSIPVSASPRATSVLLQGSPKTSTRTLFLFPDGAGSAISYVYLPALAPSIAVYGLNCPWLKTPENLVCSLEHYVAKFLLEVRRHQPHGPYYLGGASAGGILAYEAAQQLAREGEEVKQLMLLDTPDAVGLQNPNSRMYDFLDSMGMFGFAGKKAPKWLRPHFDAFLAMLDAYRVKPFSSPSVPSVSILYARQGLCDTPGCVRPELRDDDPREMKWLLNTRTDFSGAGWNSLVGSQKLKIEVLDGVNHYTILQPGEGIERLGRLMASHLIE